MSKSSVKRIAALSLLLLLFACSRQTPLEKAQEGARVAAEVYYGFLLRGDYDRFLAGRAGMEGIPDSFREQLIATYKQYALQQKKFRGGIVSIQASRAVPDSTLNLMQVFLLINYHDASSEEIVVPMVLEGDEWKMK